MRKVVIFLLFCLAASSRIPAQQTHYLEIPRYELGPQLDINYLTGLGVWGRGFGGRFHYNFNEHWALDTQATYRQQSSGLASHSGYGAGVRCGSY